MIIVENLHKSFGRNQVLKGIDLSLRDGVITAVLGPNGSGKTTFIKSLLGMVVPQQGTIEMNGKNILKDWQYRKDIGYLPQIAKFPENLKVRELIQMIKDIRGAKGNEGPLIELFDLKEFMNQPLRHLSGGTRQKVNILIAFMFGSIYYILDEPTAGLDPLSLIRFKELLRQEKEKGKAILFTTHIVGLVEELADEIIFLLEGKIFFKGSHPDLKAMQGEQTLENAIANILKQHHV